MTERTMKRVQNIVQFCKMHGFSTDYDVLGHIHAGLRSAPQTKTYQRWNEKTLAGLKASRDAGIKAYRLAVERGDVVPPPKQTWEELAAYPETERGQAAARLIEKRAARREIFTGGDVSRRGTVAR